MKHVVEAATEESRVGAGHGPAGAQRYQDGRLLLGIERMSKKLGPGDSLDIRRETKFVICKVLVR